MDNNVKYLFAIALFCVFLEKMQEKLERKRFSEVLFYYRGLCGMKETVIYYSCRERLRIRMDRRTFTEDLRRALSGQLKAAVVDRHVSYYEEYIDMQFKKGMREEEILQLLGSPRLIAKSIIAAELAGVKTGDTGENLTGREYCGDGAGDGAQVVGRWGRGRFGNFFGILAAVVFGGIILIVAAAVSMTVAGILLPVFLIVWAVILLVRLVRRM